MGRPIVPVILSGGAGTRLWPLSRSERPKQLLALTATETMLQLTIRRVDDPDRFAAPILVASDQHRGMIAEQLEAIGHSPGTIILEPVARNTAPAIALAALAAPPDALLLVMPSDHLVRDIPAFLAAVDAAAPVADDGWLVTFGITPTEPETGYGYICRGAEIAPGVHRVDRFVEKPDRTNAETYVAAGCYDWNGGIFLFRADAYLDALEHHAPAIAAAVRGAFEKARREGALLVPDAAALSACPSDSIDYAVMERADRVAVAPVAMGWSDIGSWDALHAVTARDEAGNVLQGDVLAIDTANCLIRSDGPLVAAIGVSDLIVVATGDAVLILPRGASQDVRRAVDALRAQGRKTP